MFECEGYCSEFVAMEKYRHEMLTDKMGIFVFELEKLPEEIDSSNILELFLRLFRAGTEEELTAIEELEVVEMTQMVNAYREIVNSPDYVDLERKREMNRLDEGQALRHAAEIERKKWQVVVADKDAALADKDARIAELLARLGD
jgi:hypothetical protein